MKLYKKIKTLCLVIFIGLVTTHSASWAATNIGRANLGADPTPGDTDFITDSATLTITSTTLAVVKKAFLDDDTGTEIVGGSSVVKGTIVKFMIYIDNSTTPNPLIYVWRINSMILTLPIRLIRLAGTTMSPILLRQWQRYLLTQIPVVQTLALH